MKEEFIKMKKQKIFQKLESRLLIRCLGCTFFVIFLLILIFSIWKHAEFKRLLRIKYSLASEEHTNISTLLYSEVYIESSNFIVGKQPSELVKNALYKMISYTEKEMVLFHNNKLVAGTYQTADSMDILLLQKHCDEKCYLEEYENTNSHYIKAVSSLTLLNETYIFITTTDISDIYNMKNHLTYRIIILCIVCTCIIVFPFFFAIKNFLKRSNTNMYNL